jgi:hypothetical protein
MVSMTDVPMGKHRACTCGAIAARVVCATWIGMLAACTTVPPQPPAAPPVSAPAATPAPATAPPASAPAQRPLPTINLSGYSAVFKEGFRDGCDSFRGSYRRDNARFGKINDYTIGWQDGFSICRRQGK